MKKIIYFILLIVFLAACGIYTKPTVNVNLPEKYKPIYNVGDSVIFKSDSGNFDTLVCENKNSGYYGDPRIDYGWDYVYEYYELSWSNSDGNLLRIFIDYYNREIYYSIISTNLCAKQILKLKDTIFKIDSIEELNVFFVKTNDTCNRLYEFYSAKYGLLEYKNRNKEVFKIHKYIIQ